MIPARRPAWPPLPLLRDETVIEAPVDLAGTTRRYVAEALRFMEANRDGRFFLYFAHHLPGSERVPEVDPQFRGRSGNGRYGDCVLEIDWSVGEIMAGLERLGLDDRTLVLCLSDNGTPPNKGGSNAPWGGWAYSTSEGGMRMPCLVRWPGRIPAGRTCGELCTIMDLLPTLARLAGGRADPERVIDGRDIWPLWSGVPGARSPHGVFYYYMADQLQAVRWGYWKLHLPLEKIRGQVVNRPLRLIDLDHDPAEAQDLAAEHPEVVRKLLDFAQEARAELGDLGRPGSGQRPPGQVDRPTPRLLER